MRNTWFKPVLRVNAGSGFESIVGSLSGIAILCRQWMLWHGRVPIPANGLQSNTSSLPQVRHSTMFNRSNAVSMRDDAAANAGDQRAARIEIDPTKKAPPALAVDRLVRHQSTTISTKVLFLKPSHRQAASPCHHGQTLTRNKPHESALPSLPQQCLRRELQDHSQRHTPASANNRSRSSLGGSGDSSASNSIRPSAFIPAVNPELLV